MEIKTKTIEVYIVEGKEFLDEAEAREYEEKLKKELEYTYFTISHNPDLTEGRGYYGRTVIAVPKNYAEKATALKYCFDNFGTPLEFVMGHAPMANWILGKGERLSTRKELAEFKERELADGSRNYGRLVSKDIVYLTERGEVDKTRAGDE